MNRLQKKCFIASAGFHLLLAVILVVGPAFLTSESKSDNVQLLDCVPSILVDAALSGVSGGNPTAKPPPAAPPAPKIVEPTPPPPIEKTVERDPPKDTPKESIKPTESLETSHDQHKRKLPQVSVKPVKRDSNPKTVKQTSEVDPQAQQLAENRRKVAALIGQTAQSLRQGLSPSTTIETPDYGPGGGGPAYANYAAWVKTKYDEAWVTPDDATNDDAVAKVSVTIASDGTVVSSRITKPSGDPQVDNSVRRTLDRVTFIAPFPTGAKEKQRTYIINFNLKAKRAIG